MLKLEIMTDPLADRKRSLLVVNRLVVEHDVVHVDASNALLAARIVSLSEVRPSSPYTCADWPLHEACSGEVLRTVQHRTSCTSYSQKSCFSTL